MSDGYGVSFTASKSGQCGGCGKAIVKGQSVRYKYGPGGKGDRKLCHLDCSKADVIPVSFGQAFIPDYNKGICAACSGPILKGQTVHYRYRGEHRDMVHVDCKKAGEVQQERKREQEELAAAYPYRLSGGSGYGYHGWKEGEVVRCTREGMPSYLYVGKAGSRYYREEGMSFGVGDESGYTYWALCREATEEEALPLKRREERLERIKAIQGRCRAISRQIQEQGVRPEGDNEVTGTRLFDTQNLYGSGDWFVVDGGRVWYCQNNGMDGDDWSRNNVRTGGAGAIGWYIDDEQVAQELLELSKE